MLAQHIGSDPSSLNPFIAISDNQAREVYKYIFEALLALDNGTYELKPILAESWEVSSDQKTFTFRIRQNVKWHDGLPFTADDVIYTFEKIKDPKVEAGYFRGTLAGLISVEKLDSQKVQFKFEKTDFKTLEIFAASIPIIPKHVFDNGEDFNSHPAGRAPVGTGPFKFASWVTGRKIELIRNDNYWGEIPQVLGLNFKIIPDSNVALQLLKKGGLDISTLRPIQWAKQTDGISFNEKFNKYRYWMPNYFYIAWNCRKPLFEDKRVRIALSMLINRELIREKLLFGQAELISGPFYKFGGGYDKDIEPYPYDPKKAAEFLDEAGWVDTDKDGIRDRNGIPFRFTYIALSGSDMSRDIGLIFKEDFLKVGIDMEPQTLEWGTMMNVIKERNFDAGFFARLSPVNEDPYASWHSSQADKGLNMSGFKNETVDRLTEEARLEFDKNKRMEIFKKIHKILHEEEPFTFLFTSASLVAVAKRFDNVKGYAGGIDVTEWGISPSEPILEW